MTRVLIVAAYASVRVGLHVLLEGVDDSRIIDEVGGSAELERVLPAAQPDVVLLHSEGEGDTARVLEVLAGSETALVILGDSRSEYQMLARSSLWGWAYLRKEADAQEIAGAVRAAAAGLVALDRSLAPLLADPAPWAPKVRTAVAATPSPETGESLTARESEVLRLMAQGLPNKVIASRLGISLHTVKFHVASILAKLGATSRTEAVTVAARRGYLTL